MSNDNTITNFFTDSIDRYIQTRDLNLRNINFEKRHLINSRIFDRKWNLYISGHNL